MFTADVVGTCYDMTMKKKKVTKHIRVSLRAYEILRRMAFKAHKPMVDILDEFIQRKNR